MLDKLKQYKDYIVEALLLVMTGAFLFERAKRETSDALADNQKDLEKLNDMNKQIAKNDGELAAEEKHREELQKESDADKSNDTSDPSDFLRKR